MDIFFEVTGQKMIRTDEEYIVNKSKNYLRCCFTFDASWDDYEKFVIFHSDGKDYNFLLEGDSVIVPSEVLQKRHFHLSLYGVKYIDSVEQRVTTNVQSVKLDHSGYTADVCSVDEGFDVDIIARMYSLLQGKSDVGHTHVCEDVTDLEDVLSEDLGLVLLNLTERIQEI